MKKALIALLAVSALAIMVGCGQGGGDTGAGTDAGGTTGTGTTATTGGAATTG